MIKKGRDGNKYKEQTMEVSNCCGAIPLGETYAGMGMCSNCLENTDFYDEKGEQDEG